MRPLRILIASLFALAAATVAGPLVLMGSAGAQAPFTCAAGESPNYYPCLPAVDDLDCGDITVSVNVYGGDPYGLDADGDGIGCDAQYGAPAAIPAATEPAVDPTAVPDTSSPEGLMPTVDGQCMSLDFETADLAPVTIVTPDGNVTSFTTDEGQWTVGADNNVNFTPVVNASFPTGVNLNGTTNGQTVVVTAIAECLTGRLAQVGTTAPTPAPTQPPVVDPTAVPTNQPVVDPTAMPTHPITDPTPPPLAYTGAETLPLAIAGVVMFVAGSAAIVASERMRPKA